jgi:hypothetical protein
MAISTTAALYAQVSTTSDPLSERARPTLPQHPRAATVVLEQELERRYCMFNNSLYAGAADEFQLAW